MSNQHIRARNLRGQFYANIKTIDVPFENIFLMANSTSIILQINGSLGKC